MGPGVRLFQLHVAALPALLVASVSAREMFASTSGLTGLRATFHLQSPVVEQRRRREDPGVLLKDPGL